MPGARGRTWRDAPSESRVADAPAAEGSTREAPGPGGPSHAQAKTAPPRGQGSPERSRILGEQAFAQPRQ
eukprot:13612952-Alexandrium_andersonii.AAC.1